MKTRTLAFLALVTVLDLIVAAPATEAQINPKSQLNKVLEERISQRVEAAKEERVYYNELFGDCNKYISRAVSAAEDVTKIHKGDPRAQSVSLNGLLNLELYKICRELKSGK